MSRFAFRSRLKLISLTSVMLLVAVASATAVNATTRAQPATATSQISDLDGASDQALVVRASSVRATLGFPSGTQHKSHRVTPAGVRGRNQQFDETVDADSTGKQVSDIRFDLTGRVLSAASLVGPRQGAQQVDQATAQAKAEAAARALGMPLVGPMAINADPSTGGWSVRWDRFENGVPVIGDSTTCYVLPDGEIQGISFSSKDLAPQPASLLSAQQANEVVTANLISAGEKQQAINIMSTSLAWVQPNSTLDPTVASDPTSPMQLVWVVTLSRTSDTSKLIFVYIDAGSGSLRGGDMVE